MRKKREGQEELEQVELLDSKVRNKLIEKKQWRELAMSITACADGERVQSSGSKDKMALAVDRCVDAEEEIDRAVEKLVARKMRVVQALEELDKPIEYNLLHMRYIQYMSLQEIADHYKKEYGWATTTHGRALDSFQKVWDKRFVTSCDEMHWNVTTK